MLHCNKAPFKKKQITSLTLNLGKEALVQILFNDLAWMAVVPVLVDRCSLKLAQFNPLDSGGVEFLVGVKELVGSKVSVRPIVRKAPLASHDVKSCVSQFPQASIAMTAC